MTKGDGGGGAEEEEEEGKSGCQTISLMQTG